MVRANPTIRHSASRYLIGEGVLMTGAEILTIGKAVIWWGIPLAFAIWQLVSVRREIRRDRERADRASFGNQTDQESGPVPPMP